MATLRKKEGSKAKGKWFMLFAVVLVFAFGCCIIIITKASSGAWLSRYVNLDERRLQVI